VSRPRVQQLALEAIERGEPLAWFEELYASAENEAAIPWADLEPNPGLLEWLERNGTPTGRALVIACGLGDDAEALAARGLAVSAFDIAPSAIAWCERRFPESSVDYRVANLLELPEDWRGAFDFVFEANTLQSLPLDLRPDAAAGIAGTLTPGGVAVVIARGRDEDEPLGGLPWPLTRSELTGLFPTLEHMSLEDYRDTLPIRRLRLTARRPD
jgi:ubiquinone/menaquinone biosynthesis C-methylase UbiE